MTQLKIDIGSILIVENSFGNSLFLLISYKAYFYGIKQLLRKKFNF